MQLIGFSQSLRWRRASISAKQAGVNARRSTYDPEAPYLGPGERVVWRHAPPPAALAANRAPELILILAFTGALVWIGAGLVRTAAPVALPHGAMAMALTAGEVIFWLVIFYFFGRTAWRAFGTFRDSWSTSYALTGKRLLVISRRGVLEYDSSCFHRTEAVRRDSILMFDWGDIGGKARREGFRARIAGLDSADKLAKLIRETLRP